MEIEDLQTSKKEPTIRHRSTKVLAQHVLEITPLSTCIACTLHPALCLSRLLPTARLLPAAGGSNGKVLPNNERMRPCCLPTSSREAGAAKRTNARRKWEVRRVERSGTSRKVSFERAGRSTSYCSSRLIYGEKAVDHGHEDDGGPSIDNQIVIHCVVCAS